MESAGWSDEDLQMRTVAKNVESGRGGRSGSRGLRVLELGSTDPATSGGDWNTLHAQLVVLLQSVLQGTYTARNSQVLIQHLRAQSPPLPANTHDGALYGERIVMLAALGEGFSERVVVSSIEGFVVRRITEDFNPKLRRKEERRVARHCR